MCLDINVLPLLMNEISIFIVKKMKINILFSYSPFSTNKNK